MTLPRLLTRFPAPFRAQSLCAKRFEMGRIKEGRSLALPPRPQALSLDKTLR
jgi:hypothetical protein